MDPQANICQDRIRAQLNGRATPRVAVLLGTGWGTPDAMLDDALALPYATLPGFPDTGVEGGTGTLWLGQRDGLPLAVLAGRCHAYEDGAVDAMLRPLATLQALGCHTLVQTNAAGSLKPKMPAGSLMLITDHINLPQRSPLVGLTGAQRFVDLRNAYDPELALCARDAAAALGITLFEGVYAWALGPQFETPSESRMMRMLGADAVGMSTVPETIAARYLGLRVLALSHITHLGAGLDDAPLGQTPTSARAPSGQAQALLRALLVRLAAL
ncbi:MAG: purine-nucleoside phosphorylase [Rhodoferax sp.]